MGLGWRISKGADITRGWYCGRAQARLKARVAQRRSTRELEHVGGAMSEVPKSPYRQD